MTILQLVSSEGFYGAESMICALSKGLSSLGCDVTVGVFEDARAPHIEIATEARRAGLRVQLIPCDGRLDWRSARTLRAIADRLGASIIHAHGYKADLYAYAAARTSTMKLVSTCHNWPDRRSVMQMYAALDRLVLRRFHQVATPSPRVAAILKQSGVPAEKVSWIANGIDVSRFERSKPALRRELHDAGRAVVGFVGRLVEGKGGAVLIRAAQQVLSEFPDVTFAMVGDGPCREEWTRLAANLGISANIAFTGSRDDMPGVYASFDVMVLPSFNEAMPMSLLEAMAAGVPVVSTRVGAIAELVDEGSSGYLLVPGDQSGIASSILRLLRNPGLARQFGRNGAECVRRKFSSEVMAKNYLALYQTAAPDLVVSECAQEAR